jgi:TolB-like protein
MFRLCRDAPCAAQGNWPRESGELHQIDTACRQKYGRRRGREHFTDGLADQLIYCNSALPSLFEIASCSCVLKGAAWNVKQVGRGPGVAIKARRAQGGKAASAFTVQLIDTANKHGESGNFKQ